MKPKDPEETQKNKDMPRETAPEETPDLEQALAEAKQKAEEYLTAWQRTQADFINFKRRSEQERQEFSQYANSTLYCNILPVLDDLERALNAVPEEYAQSGWVEGVKLVERKFKTILEGQGVKPICALGMDFDPNLHEALRQEKGKEGMVISEIQKGYTLHDKLLRPARVIVGKGEEETEDTVGEDDID
ncbi:MAG: nucleotide exchange factor GrpE [Dehalococcoidales bacterium]|jgi:molecular chaperone GrpE